MRRIPQTVLSLVAIASLIFTPIVNENIASALETDSPTYIVNQEVSGLIASDPLNDQTLTKEQLLAEGGYWGFGGSAESQGFPVDIFQDSQGLHIGSQSTTAGTWGGVYALSPASTAQVIHAKITAPTNLLPSDWFQSGLYVQSANGKINYVTCVASVGQWGLSWNLVRTFSDATNPFLYEVLWTDTSLNQPLTRDCTIITDGDTYLQLNLDGVTVYTNNLLNLDMPAPFIYHLEVETSQDAAMMHGVFSDFYAAKEEFVQLKVASYIPLTDFGKARILDDLGNDLSTASFNAAGVANIYISEYSFPMQGKLEILDPLNNVIFTSSATNLAGGDVYSIELPPTPTNEILPITLVSSGLMAQDMDTQPNTKEELLAMAQPNGFWYYDGSANEQNIEWLMHRDEDGLDLGVKAQSSGFYAGIFQQSEGVDATLFHSKITTPYDTIPSDWFQNGIYVQDGPNELINYIACISITGTEGTVWAVISAKGNMDFITSTETLWIDSRYNQPQTQECTIITNGNNYLKIYMDRDLVFETDSHPGLGMLPPYLYFHEPQTSYPGEFLHGKYSDFYATKSENVRVFGLPPTQFGTVKILDQVGNVLESAPVIGNEANILIGKYHFPLAAEIKLFEKNVEIASTLVTQQMYGGDEYVINFNPILDPIGDQTANEFDLLTFTATATDVDLPPDPLTFSLAGAPPGASIDPVTGVFAWTIPEGQGNVSFDVIVSDGLVSDSETINVIVSQIENPPVAADDESRTLVNNAVTINVLGNDVDPEGGALAVEVVTNPSSGIASVNPDGTILYTPDTDFYGTDTFSYKITDIAGLEDTGNVSVTTTTIKTQLVKIIVPTGLDTITVSDFVPVDADNTISLISGITQHAKGYPATTSERPRDISMRVELSSDGTSITATRAIASATAANEVWVSLIEYTGSPGGDNEFIVRDRTVNLWASQQATASYGPISSVVDASKVVVFNAGTENSNTGSSQYDRGDVMAYLDGANNVQLSRLDAAGAAMESAHQVVEFTGSNWNVQSGQAVPSPHIPAQGPEAGGTDVAVNDVGLLSNTWVYMNWQVDRANLDERGNRVWLTSETNLRLQEHAAATSNKLIQWYIISNPHQKVQTVAGDDKFRLDLQAFITIEEPVADVNNAMAWITGMTNGGGNAHPRDMWQFELSDESTINLERNRAGQNLDYRAFVIEFP